MNFHTDEYLMSKVEEHYKEALTIFPENKIIGIFYQGSGNYGLDHEHSDVDTKCIILPSFNDICLNTPLISYTHIRENNEHIDFKDVRLMFSCFKKQNINFTEILFTKYFILNAQYAEIYSKVMEKAEEIANYDKFALLRTASGMSKEKVKALDLDRPSQHDEIIHYGWASKQLHHIIRLNEFLHRFIDGETFRDCLNTNQTEKLLAIKSNGHSLYTIEEAKKVAKKYDEDTEKLRQEYIKNNENIIDKEIESFLNSILIELFTKMVKTTLS